jgi:hypothetical protein
LRWQCSFAATDDVAGTLKPTLTDGTGLNPHAADMGAGSAHRVPAASYAAVAAARRDHARTGHREKLQARLLHDSHQVILVDHLGKRRVNN